MITLSVPGALEYRDVAVRVVGAACKLFGPRRDAVGDGTRTSEPPAAHQQAAGSVLREEEKPRGELADDFVMQVVSAFSEAFNNLAIHGYQGATLGRIDIAVYPLNAGDSLLAQESASGAPTPGGAIVIEIKDTGREFDPAQYLELPDELPERGMGLFIMRSFVDEIRYVKGPPHTLTLVKRWSVHY